MRRPLPVLLFAAWVVGVGAPAAAQAPGSDSAVQFRLGGFFPSGSGGLWDSNEQTFTLDASDFNDVAFGFSFVTAMSNHLELGFNVDFYDATVRSAYRDFTDQDGFAILHDTRLETTPATVDLRFLPVGRYAVRGQAGQRRVRHPVPYFGAGVGFNYWKYQETGDFVTFDVDPPEVVFDRFVEDGIAFEAHVLAGLELPMSPNWNFLFEGRYSWTDDTPDGDFAGIGDLDLGGISAFVGVAFRF